QAVESAATPSHCLCYVLGGAQLASLTGDWAPLRYCRLLPALAGSSSVTSGFKTGTGTSKARSQPRCEITANRKTALPSSYGQMIECSYGRVQELRCRSGSRA